ncbi:MAG: amidohydrolase family protein [Kiloniellales bacterium]|nr:amidohydrolase family protein [Kiloniellales bacterium]
MATQVLFTNALLFDGVSAEPVDGASLLVEGGRIKEVSDGPIGAGEAAVIDLAGRTLMPGLIDAHFHAIAVDVDIAKIGTMPRSLVYQHARAILEGALQRGFTTVRDAGGGDYGLARATETDLIRGPRLFYSGRALTQTGGHADFRDLEADAFCLCCLRGTGFERIADGVPEVRRAARDELRKGATQIKIMASGGVASPSDPIWNLQYSEEEIRAIVWEATSWRTYVMAHAYTAEAIRRCVEFGVRSIEHANLIDAETAAFCARQGAFVVPTLVTYEMLHRHGAEIGFPEVSLRKLEEVRGAGLRALELLKAAGVQMGLGTDLLGALHAHQNHEFSIRAEVLTPHEILVQATSNNARLLNREGELGVAQAGALADLIVVEGDPLREISVLDTQGDAIPLIMKGGQLYKNAL